MESVVARDSGVVLVAKRSGYVNQVDASRIVISAIEKRIMILGLIYIG